MTSWASLSHTCCYSCSFQCVQAENDFEVTPITQTLPRHCEKTSSQLSLCKHPHSCIHARMNSWTVIIPTHSFFCTAKSKLLIFQCASKRQKPCFMNVNTDKYNIKQTEMLHMVGMHLYRTAFFRGLSQTSLAFTVSLSHISLGGCFTL